MRGGGISGRVFLKIFLGGVLMPIPVSVIIAIGITGLIVYILPELTGFLKWFSIAMASILLFIILKEILPLIKNMVKDKAES